MRLSAPTASLLRLMLAGVLALANGSARAAECGALKQMASLDLVLENGRALVAVSISGRPKHLIVDTGGALTSLTRQAVEEFGLVRRQAATAMVGVSGTRSDQFVTAPNVSLGGATVDAVRFMVDPNDLENGIAGTLGPDFLRNFDLDFDFGSSKLNLMSPLHCEGNVIYWKPNTLAVISVQIDDTGHIQVPIVLDGQELRAMVDTGAPFAAINLTTARRRFGIDVNSPDVEERGRDTSGAIVYLRRFGSFKLDGVALNSPIVRLLPDLMRDALRPNPGSMQVFRQSRRLPEFLIGLSTLSEMHVYVAYGERKIYVTDRGPPPAPQAR